MITLLIASVIFPICALVSIRKYPAGYDMEKVLLNKEQTTVLKGILIAIVYIHHFGYIIEIPHLEKVYRVAPISVGLFFLVLGYTTYIEFSRTEELNVKNIIIKKIVRLYLPIMIFQITTNNFLGGLLWFFVFSIIGFKFFKGIKQDLFIIFGNISFVIFCLLIHLPEYWYDDVLTFAVGFLIAKYKKDVVKMLQNKFFCIAIGIVSVVVCALSVWCILDWKYYNITTMTNTFFFSLIGVLFLSRFTLSSTIFSFIGNLSWEIYFLHQITIMVVARFINRPAITLVLAFAMSVLEAHILQIVWFKLWGFIKKKFNLNI